MFGSTVTKSEADAALIAISTIEGGDQGMSPKKNTTP